MDTEKTVSTDDKYEKKVERTSNLMVVAVVAFVIIIVYFITNTIFDKKNVTVVNVPKAKKIEIENIKDAKVVKDYKDTENVDSFDYIEFGNYNGKSIEWIVLKADKGEALIISKYVLKSNQFYIKDKKNFGENWWEISNVKEWLNNEFYNESFNSDEKNKIVEKGFMKKEKVTILDNKEIKNLFGMNNKLVINNHTKTILLPGIQDDNIDLSDGYVPYWTKTVKSDRISVVKSSGELNEDGYLPTHNKIGIRPAMYIKY